MLRGDNVVCGTTSTGTGTLTLAACPTPPGGIDFDVFARAMGFGNSAAIVVSYTIIEYTSSAFVTTKSHEKGVGVLTLGSSSGIANCTLARSVLNSTATNLNSQPATQNIKPGSGISIGVAANTLVFIAPSIMDFAAYNPTMVEDWVPPLGCTAMYTGQDFSSHLQKQIYFPFMWHIPKLVKKITMSAWAAYTGGTPVSDIYASLYQIGINGKPGKLLVDFGHVGPAGASLNTGFADIASGVHSTGYFLIPGEYYLRIWYNLSGGSSGGTIKTYASGTSGEILSSGRVGGSFNLPNAFAVSDTSGASSTAADPAYVTGWSTITSSNNFIAFYLSEA